MEPSTAPASTRPAPAFAPRHTAPALTPEPSLVVCDECEAVHERIHLPAAQVSHCVRCGAMLGRGHVVKPMGLLAFAVATLVFLLIGNLAPLVTLDLRGLRSEVSLPQALLHTWQAGQHLVALLAAATAIGFPLAVTLLRLYLLLPLVRGVVPRGFVPAMRALSFATHWSMVEVLMLGALIAIVRSAGLANVTAGPGLFAYVAVTLLLTSTTAAGLHMLWKLPEKQGALA